MKLFNSLIFNGQAEEAAKYYANILGGEYSIVKYRDILPEMSQFGNFVARAIVKGDEFCLIMRDNIGLLNQPLLEVGYKHITVLFEDEEKSKLLYDVLYKEAKRIDIKFGCVSFAKAYGQIVDKYNVCWEIVSGVSSELQHM
ncbi:MAG: VOC family protein [Firmicutes bacterium]|nr:VOC family protein [Bacillota bacterium]